MQTTVPLSWNPTQAWPSYDVSEAGVCSGSETGPPNTSPVSPFISVTVAGWEGSGTYMPVFREPVTDKTHRRGPSLDSVLARGMSTVPQSFSVPTSTQLTAPPSDVHQTCPLVAAIPSTRLGPRFIAGTRPVLGSIRMMPVRPRATMNPSESVIGPVLPPAL